MEPYRTLIFQDFLSNGIIFLILLIRYLKNTFTIDALISVKKNVNLQQVDIITKPVKYTFLIIS